MPRTVLLADDSVTAQNMGRRILMDAGYEVITVNNGSAALKKIHENHPDLIVLDVYMPGYGGLEVCQRLKESGETMRIPVLLTVGKMEPFKAEEAKRVRADAHIVKPFEASELLAALAKLEDRIVPQADASRGRKTKKPSFWHDDESAPAEEESTPAPPTKVAAFPQVPEARGELPVIADPTAFSETAEETAAAQVSVETRKEPVPAEVAAPVSHGGAEEWDAETEPDRPAAAEVQQDHSAVTEPGPAANDEPVRSETEADVKTSASSGGQWVAENVALSPEEAALELDQEMRAAAGASVLAESKEIMPPTPQADTATNGATFAAAAGASASGTTVPVGGADEQEPASEAVAAWENWRHIRDAVMNAPGTAAIAERVAQAAKAGIPVDQAVPLAEAAKPQEAPMPQPAAEPSASSSDLEAGALASIVDTVLAELKPKLMEEIAKKLKK